MTPFDNVFNQYITRWYETLYYDDGLSFQRITVAKLAVDLRDCWIANRQVFLCGNGGSAANAVHLANDLIYPVTKSVGRGLNATALTANPAVVTCIANDEGYENVFSIQLNTQAQPRDVLIALSGSGNSPNILEAIKRAKSIGLKTHAILGFDGGKAKDLADNVIHVDVDDMQIAEDMQLVVGHIIIQWLALNNPHAVTVGEMYPEAFE